jgi:hypothetical protein
MIHELYQSQFTHINGFRTKGEAFQYGATTATIRDRDSHKKLRQISTRADRILTSLEIPIQSGENVIVHDNGNKFAEMNLGGQIFYIDPRNPINGQELGEILAGKQPDISIVTGSCLFSAETARVITESGRNLPLTTPGVQIDEKIASLAIDPRLSLYEVETLNRLPSFINAMVREGSNINRLHVNVPDVEYYLYALSAYEQGFLSSEHALEWFDHVDTRHERLFQQMSRRSLRGINQARDLEVIDDMPLAPIKPYILDSVAAGDVPSIQNTVELLADQSSLWNDILTVESPMTWQDINDLSYVYAELQAGYNDPVKKSSNQVRLAVVVDNPSESKIVANAKRIAGKLPNPNDYNLIALFLHEHLLPSKGTEKTMYHIPGQILTLSDAKTIFQAYAV